MSRRKAEMVLELIDRATGPARRFIRMQDRMGKAVEASNKVAARSARTTDRAASRTERTLAMLAQTARRSFQAVVDGSRRAGRAVGALHRKTVQLGKLGIGQIGQGWNRSRGGLMAGAAAVTVAYGAAAAAAAGLVGTASEFEKFQTILETTEGSSAAAKKAMGWVQDFAVTTPYELAQVTDAFVQLRAYGLDPTQGLMVSLGDTAAAMGKPLSQAVEAMADAVMGENERLKEFGITASKTGDKITYSYTNAAGEQVKAAVRASDRIAIQQKLMDIMNEKYGGSMERLSATWDGMISNVLDLWTKFQMMIMNAGLFDWMKGKLREVLDTINQMQADGTLQEWATSIGITIQNALTQMWDFGKGVFALFVELKGYLSSAAEYVGGWDNLAKVLAAIAFAPTLIATAAGLVQIASGLAMLTTALMANPIVLAIAAIAAGGLWIYNNWSGLVVFFEAFGKAFMNALGPARPLVDGFIQKVQRLWSWIRRLVGPLDASAEQWEAWGTAVGDYVGSALLSVQNFFAALNPFNWGDYIGEINWAGLVGGTFAISTLIKPIAWSTKLLGGTVKWALLGGKFVLSTLIKPIVWSTKLLGGTVKWALLGGKFALSGLLTPIRWGAALIPKIGWLALAGGGKKFALTGLLTALKWGARLIPGIGWAVLAGELAWHLLIKKIDWSQFEWLKFDWKSLLPHWNWGAIVPDIDLGKYLKRPSWLGGSSEVSAAVEISNPETLLEAARAAEHLETQFPKITAAAAAALTAATASLNSITTTFAAADYTSEGARLIQSLANGMLAQKEAVRQAALAIGQTIRTALPNSASAKITVNGAETSAPTQKRARGGSYAPGWLMTGEQGPELEYKSRGGYIAHNRALTNMAAMSDKIANANQQPGRSAWLKGAAVSAGIATTMAAVPAAAEVSSTQAPMSEAAVGAKYMRGGDSTSVSLSAPVSITIAGSVTPDVMTDLEARLTRHKEEISSMMEEMNRMKRRREHG